MESEEAFKGLVVMCPRAMAVDGSGTGRASRVDMFENFLIRMGG
jgi:hypothetical protein